MHCLILRSPGAAGEGDVAIDKIAHTTGLRTVVVRGHAVEENRIKDLLSQEIRLAVVQRVRHNVIELFRVTLIVVVLIARGLGTPGVRARDAACRNKPERSILHETQAVEDFHVRLYGAKRETATLGCKLRCFLFHYYCCQTFPLSIEHLVDFTFGLLFSRRFFLRLSFFSR